MITLFDLFEAQQRKYYGGNLFSNSHRSPNLPASCTMIDIDNFIVDNNTIIGIAEDKFKFDSKVLGNPLQGNGTWQRRKFSEICDKLSIDFYLLETSTDSKYLIKNNVAEKIDSITKGQIFETNDRIYIEIRYGKPKSIMFRTEGMKISEIQSDIMFNYALMFSNMLGISIFLVNDIENYIYIMKWPNGKIYTIIPNSAASWKDVYQKNNLL